MVISWMMKPWHVLLFYSFLTGGSEFQVARAVELSSISGSQPVCHDETVVYSCSTTRLKSLTWNFNSPPGGPHISSCTLNNKTGRFCSNEYLASVQIETGKNLSSLLVILYKPKWNGTAIQCMEGRIGNESLLYVIAGPPASPTMVWHTMNMSEQSLKLHWHTADYVTDCSMTVIEVNGKNSLNVSCLTVSASLDISEYISNTGAEDSITIQMYNVNKCNMVSKTPTQRTVNITGNGPDVLPSETFVEKVLSISIPSGVVTLLIGLVVGFIIGSRRLCNQRIPSNRSYASSQQVRGPQHDMPIIVNVKQ